VILAEETKAERALTCFKRGGTGQKIVQHGREILDLDPPRGKGGEGKKESAILGDLTMKPS